RNGPAPCILLLPPDAMPAGGRVHKTQTRRAGYGQGLAIGEEPELRIVILRGFWRRIEAPQRFSRGRFLDANLIAVAKRDSSAIGTERDPVCVNEMRLATGKLDRLAVDGVPAADDAGIIHRGNRLAFGRKLGSHAAAKLQPLLAGLHVPDTNK